MKKCPHCGSPNADEWEKCVICGSPLHQSSSPSPEQYVLLYKRPEEVTWRRWLFSSLERARAMAQHFQARGFETRIMYIRPKPRPVERRRRMLFEEVWREVELARQGSHSNPQEVELIIKEEPMTWREAGSWLAAEGSFYVKANEKLLTRTTVVQKNRQTGGYKILKELRDFIDADLGTRGYIYEYAERPAFLMWESHLDNYKIAAKAIPYLRHPAKIREAVKMLSTIEAWKKKRVKELTGKIPLLEGVAKAITVKHLREHERDLAEIRKIKEEYPYLKALYT